MQNFIVEIKTKVCTKCKNEKALDDFHDAPRMRLGKQSRCKACQVESTKKWRRESTDSYLMSGRKTASKNKAYWRTHNPYEETKTRRCPHCDTDKPSLDFDECHSLSDGLQSWCRLCSGERLHNVPIATAMFWAAKNRAKMKGIKFFIGVEDIVVPEVCPVLGIPLYTSRGKARPNSPSLDRIRNEKGYVPGNVRVISYRANLIKNNATAEELRGVLRYIERETK